MTHLMNYCAQAPDGYGPAPALPAASGGARRPQGSCDQDGQLSHEEPRPRAVEADRRHFVASLRRLGGRG